LDNRRVCQSFSSPRQKEALEKASELLQAAWELRNFYEECNQAAETLKNYLNSWLSSEQFRPIKRLWQQE
jgi:hypothetical protein